MFSDRNSKESPERARTGWQRGRVAIFLAAWTAFVVFAAWWLIHASAGGGGGWATDGSDLAKSSLADRIKVWFKLANLNFHGVYPWILLAPYVAWVGLRFHLESGQRRISVPVHLAGCALFAVASSFLNSHAGWGRVIVSIHSMKVDNENGKGGSIRTNEFKIFTNGPPPPFHLPPDIDHAFKESAASGGIAGFAAGGGGGGWGGGGERGWHDSVFWTQGVHEAFSDFLNVLAYASLVGITQAVHFHRRSRERERRAAALEAQLAEARLNTLQAQLHPHFLFNALNAISTLLRRDTRAAQDALASFSDLLRLALSQSSQPEVLLSEDLRFLRRYVEIQSIRLGERLSVEEVISRDAMNCLVPVLLLQPLVENAIRHGIESSSNPGLVRVIVQPEASRLAVTVEDNGVGLSPVSLGQSNEGGGIGLENLRARLASLYGSEQRVEIAPRPEGGVTVRVEIPFRSTRSAEKPQSALAESAPINDAAPATEATP